MAQICKFFASGQCRFGRDCRFVHPGPEPSSSFGNNTLGNTRQAGFGTGGTQAKLGDGFNLPTAESIRTDLTERPTWFLSSYAPGKDPPAQLIDGKDISPEEARVMAYKLRAEGNPAAYEAEWNRLTGQANTQIRNILSDLPGAVGFMKHAYETISNSRYNSNNTTPSAFGNMPSQLPPFVNSEQSTSAFAQTSAFSQPSLPVSAFGQQSQPNPAFGTASPFNARPTPGFGQSAFGQPPAAPAFGQPAFGAVLPSQPQSAFGQSTLGQSTLAKPAFGQPAFGQPPVLGQTTSPFANPNPVSTSAFGQPPVLGQTTSPFANPNPVSTSAFGQASPFAAANIPKPAFGQPAFGQSSFAQSQPFVTSAATPHVQPHTASAFGQPQQHLSATSATFGQSGASAPNVFQQTAVQNASSPFSKSNPFQQSQQAASNLFQQTSQPPQPVSAFGQSSAPVSAFAQSSAPVSAFATTQGSSFSNQNSFQGAQQQQQQQQSAGYQANPVLREQQKAKKWDDPVIEYIQAEADAFAASAFTLGNVPTVAPSREMCWG